MRTQIVLWNDKKYGDYSIWNAMKIYNNKSYTVDKELDDVVLSTSQYSFVVADNIIAGVQSNIVDTDNNINIVFCYPIKN